MSLYKNVLLGSKNWLSEKASKVATVSNDTNVRISKVDCTTLPSSIATQIGILKLPLSGTAAAAAKDAKQEGRK